MKLATALMAGLLFTGTLGVVNSAVAADPAFVKQDLASDDYCHEKFLSLKSETTPDDQQQVVDFYGPCSETPRGQDQVRTQQDQYNNDWTNNFED